MWYSACEGGKAIIDSIATGDKVNIWNRWGDLTINSSQLYYRLKVIDLNGDVSYSKIVSIPISGNVAFNIFPNPLKDYLHVTLSGRNETANLQIINTEGRLMISKKVYLDGETFFSINTSSLAPGKYSLIVNNKEGRYIKEFFKK